MAERFGGHEAPARPVELPRVPGGPAQGAVRRTARPGQAGEQWHGVYLVSFSNGCHKVGYSSGLQERVAAHARTAMNFRITVDEVHLQVIGAETDAREAEARLIRAFGLAAGAVEAQEYFYGLTARRARSLFAKICANHSGAPVVAREPINEAAPVAAYGRSGVQASEETQDGVRRDTDDLSASFDRGVVRTQRLVNDLIAQGWIPPGGDTSTEWSVRYSPTSYSLPTTEAHARKRVSSGTGLVCRAVGPWTEITE